MIRGSSHKCVYEFGRGEGVTAKAAVLSSVVTIQALSCYAPFFQEILQSDNLFLILSQERNGKAASPW